MFYARIRRAVSGNLTCYDEKHSLLCLKTQPVMLEKRHFEAQNSTRGKNLYNILSHFSNTEKAVYVKGFSQKTICQRLLKQTQFAYKIKRKYRFLLCCDYYFVTLQIETVNTGRLSEHLNTYSALSLACWPAPTWPCCC